MKKELGSIFPLSNEALCEAESTKISLPNDRIYYSLCREALYDIAIYLRKENENIVLIPAYTCQTVISPFEEAGWDCILYSIQKDMRIDTRSLEALTSQHHPSLVVVHPFYGMELNSQEEKALQHLNGNGIKIIIDLTQCLFSTKRYPFVDFYVASYRKWFPIPDGGFLECDINKTAFLQPQKENTEYTERQISAMYLRGQYFGNGDQRTKSISIQINKKAESLARQDMTPHKMSDIAYSLLQKENIQDNQAKRFENYTFLFRNIRESNKVKKVCQNLDEVTTAPLYFSIYVQNRPELQHILAQDAIYAPILWPVEDKQVLINDEIRYIYDHILCIPCDQRYNIEDMQRVITIINNY